MHALWVVEGHITSAVASEYALRLPSEYDFLDFVDIISLGLLNRLGLPFLSLFLEFQAIVKDSLFLISVTPVVSAFHKLLDQPLDDREYFSVIQTLYLLWSKHLRALHLFESSYDFLGELNLLAHIEVIGEFNVDVEVAAGNGPAHAAQDFIKRLNCVEARPEIAACDEDVIDLLK